MNIYEAQNIILFDVGCDEVTSHETGPIRGGKKMKLKQYLKKNNQNKIY